MCKSCCPVSIEPCIVNNWYISWETKAVEQFPWGVYWTKKISKQILVQFLLPWKWWHHLKIIISYQARWCSNLDTLNSKICSLVMILWDKEFCWPHPYISVPKGNIALIILLQIARSESTLQDDHLDTLSSKIHPLVIILRHNIYFCT